MLLAQRRTLAKRLRTITAGIAGLGALAFGPHGGRDRSMRRRYLAVQCSRNDFALVSKNHLNGGL